MLHCNCALSVKQPRSLSEIDGKMYFYPPFNIHVIKTYDAAVQTTIRIRFTDRTQLEKIFPSTDKIRSVYAFVRSSLRDDVKPIKFILCKTGFCISKSKTHDF